MIFKVLILGAVLYAVYFIFFKKPSMLKDKYKDSDTVVECAKCGIYADVKETVYKDGKNYCCHECAGLK